MRALSDAAGNLTDWNLTDYTYDAFNQMVRMTSGAQDWAYAYTAGDERLWSYDLTKQEPSRWALRDLSGQVLCEYLNEGGTWTVGTDYIHRDGQLLAAETRLGRRHFHLDHLGTPRLITNSVGYKTAYHAYYPFGEEATAFNQDGERMKFTGHERDLGSAAGAGMNDLDYMHARHCSRCREGVNGCMLNEEKRCVGIFCRDNRFYVQPYCRTTAGVLLGGSPVQLLECSASDEEIGRALQLAFSHARKGVPHPTDWDKIPQPLYEAAGVKSWNAFVKGARSCEVDLDGENINIVSMFNAGSRKGFQFLNELTIKVPVAASVDELGRSVRFCMEKAE